MFSGLRYLHECCALIHRDLKPENLLVDTHTGQPNVCITDFGLSVFEKKKTGQANTARESFLEAVNRNFTNLQPNKPGRKRHAAGDRIEDKDDQFRRRPIVRDLTAAFSKQVDDESAKPDIDVAEVLEQRTNGKPGTKYYKAPEIVSRSNILFKLSGFFNYFLNNTFYVLDLECLIYYYFLASCFF